MSDGVLNEIAVELAKAEMKFPPFNSAHEGYAVLLEEVIELQAEVFKGGGEPRSIERMRAEAIQVAAMGARFVKFCDGQNTDRQA